LNEMARRLAEELDPEEIILFGSRAWGTPDAESDEPLQRTHDVEALVWTAGFRLRRSDVMRIVNDDPGVAAEIGDVEGEKIHHAMDVHGCHDAGIVHLDP